MAVKDWKPPDTLSAQLTPRRGDDSRQRTLSPEVVRKVADRVYELWRQALVIERERGGRPPSLRRGER